MNTPFGDFRLAPDMNNDNDNGIDMTFNCHLDLSHFNSPRVALLMETYKKQCNYQERVTFMYFCKALSAYQAMQKMLTLQDKYGTIVNRRVDSDIISKKELANYINEIYQSFYDACISLEYITLDMQCDVNNIFLKIVHNSEKEFTDKMFRIAIKERVLIYGI